MKKSNIFYFVALTVSLIAYSINIMSYLTGKNSSTLSEAGSHQINIFLAIIIAMAPLFALSIWQMVKSVRKNNLVSLTAIIFLMINSIIMFGLFSYAVITNYFNLYEQYTNLINMGSANEEIIKVYAVQRTNLFYSLISGFIVPVVYLVTSILSIVFRLEESRIKENC